MNIDVKQTNELSAREVIEIMEARTAVFVVEQECPYQEVDADDYEALHVRLLKEDQLQAYARILVMQDGIHFGRVLVKQDARGNGYAQELIKAILETIQARFPGQPVMIQAQAYLLDFYASFGFEAISDEYLEDNIPHVDMKLKN
ncbi:GNAT family N-acetyltransferase [Weissella minor]|uniref:GNAT family N-acetyltransferase n=1 Tax=Weissella minor TaxID=1620 RepID=UPI001BAF8CC4|nr:GNAT family N-acetyltransferase [Weissella minor]MBS0949544.1 GNAT family N-acetyltransferase [Weissella minor]